MRHVLCSFHAPPLHGCACLDDRLEHRALDDLLQHSLLVKRVVAPGEALLEKLQSAGDDEKWELVRHPRQRQMAFIGLSMNLHAAQCKAYLMVFSFWRVPGVVGGWDGGGEGWRGIIILKTAREWNE